MSIALQVFDDYLFVVNFIIPFCWRLLIMRDLIITFDDDFR